jgi:ABC-type uncharacterized transport system substrate-binding protein
MITRFRIALAAALAPLVALLAEPAPARAHPHVFVDARAEVVIENDAVVAIRHVWRFDEAFTAFATQGLDANNDGALDREELQPLAKVNVESLLEFDYFTFVRAAGVRQGFDLPKEYWLDFNDGKLTLFFRLDMRAPIPLKGKAFVVDVFDPGYFVDFALVETDPAVLSGGAPTCAIKAKPKADPDEATAALLATIPPSERELPPHLMRLTQDLANRIEVTCP